MEGDLWLKLGPVSQFVRNLPPRRSQIPGLLPFPGSLAAVPVEGGRLPIGDAPPRWAGSGVWGISAKNLPSVPATSGGEVARLAPDGPFGRAKSALGPSAPESPAADDSVEQGQFQPANQRRPAGRAPFPAQPPQVPRRVIRPIVPRPTAHGGRPSVPWARSPDHGVAGSSGPFQSQAG